MRFTLTKQHFKYIIFQVSKRDEHLSKSRVHSSVGSAVYCGNTHFGQLLRTNQK